MATPFKKKPTGKKAKASSKRKPSGSAASAVKKRAVSATKAGKAFVQKGAKGRKKAIASGKKRIVAVANQPFWQAVSAAVLVAGIIFTLSYLLMSSPATNAPRTTTAQSTPKKQTAETKKRQPSSQPTLLAQSANKTAAPEMMPEVVKALAELQNLPFEEQGSSYLQGQIQDIDNVLGAALDKAGLPTTALNPGRVESRQFGDESYFFQHISVLTGNKTPELYTALVNTLAPLGANVVQRNSSLWDIMIGKVATHQIMIFPHVAAFPDTAYPSVDKTQAKHVRAAGEPAYVAIVIDDLGMSLEHVRRLSRLSYPVTFAFWPHGVHTQEGAAFAHKHGKEVLVHIPMEPISYPRTSPGPNALLKHLTPSQIEQRVRLAIDKVPFAVGANNHMGSRFTQRAEGVGPVLSVLDARGLFMLDSVTHPRSVFYREAKQRGMQAYERQVFLDHKQSRSQVLAQLKEAQRIALRHGQAIAIGHPLPETLIALEEWQHIKDGSVKIVRLQDLPRR